MKGVFKRPRGTLGKWFGVKYWKPYFSRTVHFMMGPLSSKITS